MGGFLGKLFKKREANVLTPPEGSMRARNLEILSAEGFRVAPGLPWLREETPTALRPASEIAARLLALITLFLWVVEAEQDLPEAKLRPHLQEFERGGWFTEGELEILKLARAEANDEHSGTIGWRLENIWGLAWVMGFETQPAMSGTIPRELTQRIFDAFLTQDFTVANVVAGHPLRSLDEVEALEDLFYCLHNAVRSAQLGGNTVPRGFHPISDGGGVHERRHSLTWCLSPGVDWDDTDLST